MLLILSVAVSLIREMVASVDSLKTHSIPNGHLPRFVDMLEKCPVNEEVEFQGNTLEGKYGMPKCGDVHTGTFSFQTAKKRPLSCV